MDVSQYLEIFIDESSEHLQNLSDCIMTLENEPENKDTINEVFRAAHSLKGMAGTMGFKRMQTLTHDMENVFQEVRSDKIKVDSSMIDLLFECLDALDKYLENIKATSDEGTEDNEIIIKELNDFIAKAQGKVAEEPVKVVKEEPKKETSGAEAKYHRIELNEDEKAEVETAIAAGKKLYGVTVYIEKDCLLKAARAFLVFRAVEEFGHILVNRPSVLDIEDEKFELDFSFWIVSDENNADKIIHVLDGKIQSIEVVEKTDSQQEETSNEIMHQENTSDKVSIITEEIILYDKENENKNIKEGKSC